LIYQIVCIKEYKDLFNKIILCENIEVDQYVKQIHNYCLAELQESEELQETDKWYSKNK
jgi:hypothetical protein